VIYCEDVCEYFDAVGIENTAESERKKNAESKISARTGLPIFAGGNAQRQTFARLHHQHRRS
jgi:hypothetical protein